MKRERPPQEDAAAAQARGPLHGKRIAILATDGFEQVELVDPRRALVAAGASSVVIAPHGGSIRGWKHTEWGDPVTVDRTLENADPEDFDALLLPGGVLNPDKLRTDAAAVRFVRAMFEAEKPIAAICHGPIMLIEADVLRGGRHVTSWPSLQTDVRNAGGRWSDQEVVVDGSFVTSRKPDDIPAFNEAMVAAFAQHAIGPRTDVLPEG